MRMRGSFSFQATATDAWVGGCGNGRAKEEENARSFVVCIRTVYCPLVSISSIRMGI